MRMVRATTQEESLKMDRNREQSGKKRYAEFYKMTNLMLQEQIPQYFNDIQS